MSCIKAPIFILIHHRRLCILLQDPFNGSFTFFVFLIDIFPLSLISILLLAIKTMTDVGIVIWLCPRESNVLHDLMFAFARNFMSGQNHLNVPPI
ncbi:hypothetical protein ARMSODRAFT_421211 [Armillaria solidipes]|uniref:Uncharacterized protein n=1 Tax=Armillaria solidipes TaxID=1076256 RepID=A0A2H3CL51_9AGAR|nr:hypothetical protein ARMSODRAFT_421211 [Armillaria solidipes]